MRSKVNFLSSFVLAIAMIGSLSAQGTDPGTANLKHSWTFEDGTTNDYVGGANGTLVGDAEISDGSLFISEQDQYMEMPGGFIALDTYDEITLEIWYIGTPGVNTGYTMIVYFGDEVDGFGADGYFLTAARGDDKSRAAISCGVYTNSWTGESGADGPEYDDDWLHHMASTLTGDSITLYIDGVRTGASALSSTNGIWGISENYAYLGKGGYAADPEWIGEIPEFNIYNRALTTDEILFQNLRGPVTGAVDVGKTAVLPVAVSYTHLTLPTILRV